MSALNHMDFVKTDDLEALLVKREGPCVSMFMPTERVGAEVQQNPIRLKNMIAQAEDSLIETKLSASQRRDLLASIQAMQKDHAFAK